MITNLKCFILIVLEVPINTPIYKKIYYTSFNCVTYSVLCINYLKIFYQ